jgi:type IV fimbrial biogenesis protein FimT
MPRSQARTALPVPGSRRGLPHAARAFTLVELLVALGIAALLAAAAVPTFRDWLGAYQLANHAKHVAETMTRARTEAIRRGHRVNLCKSPDLRQCAGEGSWEGGFLMYVDLNRDGRVDAGEPVLGIDGHAPPGITITANRPLDEYVSYTSVGHARQLNGALQMGTLTICKSGQRALLVVLAGSGRVRTERIGSVCP